MPYDPGPQPLSQAISQLFALRGYARAGAQTELEAIWATCVRGEVARWTRPAAIRRGVLTVHVAHAPLLAELTAYERTRILALLQAQQPHLKLRDLKFKLESGLLGQRTGP